MKLNETPWEEEGKQLANVLKDLGRELTSLVCAVGTPHELMIEPVGVHTYQLSWSFLPGQDILDDDFIVLSKTMQHVASRMLAKHGLTATMLPLAVDPALGTEAVGMHVELPKTTKTGVLKYLSKNVGSQDLDDLLDESVQHVAQEVARNFVNWLIAVGDELKDALSDVGVTGPVIQVTQLHSEPKATLSFYLEKDADEDEARLSHELLVYQLKKMRSRETNDVHRDHLHQLIQLSFWNALDWNNEAPSFYMGASCQVPLGAHVPTVSKLLHAHRGKLQESISEMDTFDISRARAFISSLHNFRDKITAVIEENASKVQHMLGLVGGNAFNSTHEVSMTWMTRGLGDDEIEVIAKLLQSKLGFIAAQARPTWLRKSFKDARMQTQQIGRETHTINVIFPLPSDYKTFIDTVQQELNE